MNEAKRDFFVAGGALRYDAPSYVERLADRQLQESAAAGELCYVLTTRQMGKTSLMVRTAAYLQKNHIQTAIIDLTSIGTAQIDAWFLSVLDDLQSQLPLITDVEEWWEENRSLSQVKRFTKFVQEVVPKEVDGQVAIFIDEIDSMLNLDFADNFFAAIRAIYNRGASLPVEQRVSFILLGVAAPNDLIKDQTRTPFNVGRRIRLEELSLEEAEVLLQGLPGESQAILERIFFWTNGHPYLTQKIGLAIAREEEREWTDSAIDDLVERLFLTDAALNEESNLQFVRGRVISSPNKRDLLALYRKVYEQYQIRSNEQSAFQNELKLYGLLRTGDKRYLTIRNRIYRRVFNEEWIKEHSPVNWWRRFAAITALVIILAAIAGVYIWRISSQSNAVLAQSYISDFEDTANSTIRLSALANLFALEEYDQEAMTLFASLPLEEQLALFENLTPDLDLQVRQVAKNVYTTLYLGILYPDATVHATPEPCDTCSVLAPEDFQAEMRRTETTRLLEAMIAALEQSADAESRALHDEIGIWLEARRYFTQEDYLSARIAYDLAISLNEGNPATRLERAVASARLGDSLSAISDLTDIWQQGPIWERAVIDTISQERQIWEGAWSMEDPPPFIEHVPTPIATLDPTSLPQMPAREEAPISTATPLGSPVPENSPAPVLTPETIVLANSVEGSPIKAVRFGNGNRVVVFVGGLQGGYSPGAVYLAERAVQYFGDNLEAIPDSITLYIVVNINPDALNTPGLWEGRLNANGVDLNRNWDCEWEEDTRIANATVRGAGGSEPFSEPETEALREFFLTVRPQAVVFWIARAASGIIMSGGCQRDPLISNQLGEIYSEASRYRHLTAEEAPFVPGDATNWLTDQNIPAVSVLLPEYDGTDWNNNLAGMLAVLESYK